MKKNIRIDFVILPFVDIQEPLVSLFRSKKKKFVCSFFWSKILSDMRMFSPEGYVLPGNSFLFCF